MRICQRIKQIRTEKGWKQADLAEKLEVSQKQISSYETGYSTPPTDVLIRLAEVFEVSLDYLAFEVQGQSAKINVKDRELLRRFEALDNFSESEKNLVKEVIDLVITKHQILTAVSWFTLSDFFFLRKFIFCVAKVNLAGEFDDTQRVTAKRVQP